MRRFIVEVVIDALLLFFIALLLGVFSMSQPFPFGTSSAPIIALRGAGIVGFLSPAAILILVNRSPDRYSWPSPAGCCSRRWASSS